MAKKGMPLEADPSILENNLRFVKDEFEDEFNNIFQPLTQERPSKVIKPTTGFCIKAFQVKNGKKIFINICHTDGIPAPIDISETDLTEILQSDEPHSYKVPMSLSDPRLATDKSGKQETACDIAINTKFFKKIEKGGLFQNFFITLIFEALDNKYDIEINEENWLILKNRTVFGTLVPHRIQDRDVQKVKEYNGETGAGETSNNKKPLIEEIAESDYKKLSDKRTIKPEHKLIQETQNGEVNKLIAQFQLPECVSAAEIALNVNDDRLLVECKKHKYYFDGFVNVFVDADNCKSHFDLETKTLTVDLPVLNKK
ncbi:PIH1 domain-containing protein 1 [Culicoides brevitarsis]|uniref:PIH1 domain-containing protein 1 n=1 Tax=Culicoides brevitarsis TaxID=469753 RepID=UPI00307C587C